MSGHSHAKTVMGKKMADADKRGKIFSKMSKLITIAAKEGGGDPNMNARLRQALDEAKRNNMPKDNIERAIKKGTGELEGEALEEFSYDALGPHGLLLIIDGITDNKNRVLGEVRQIMLKNNGKLADEGAVKWAFKHRGIIKIEIEKNDENELILIESGAEDIEWTENGANIITDPESLELVKNKLSSFETISSLGWIPNEKIEDHKSFEKILEELEDNDSVQQIYTNL